jgi:hypothetical protein
MAKRKIGKYTHRMPVTSKYRPVNKSKYKGDYTNIIFRSSWEKIVFKYCDLNPAVLQWSSEEFFVPYKSPFDGKYHRYFPDIWLKYKNKEGIITQSLLEIKPKKYTQAPRKPKRVTKDWKYTTEQYIINRAKWDATETYCKKKGYKFSIITEDVLKHWSTIQPLNR